jgi:hypothetical protein
MIGLLKEKDPVRKGKKKKKKVHSSRFLAHGDGVVTKSVTFVKLIWVSDSQPSCKQ